MLENSMRGEWPGYCKDKKGHDHMSVDDMMEVDGVHGQTRLTFAGVLTAVPTGSCQATVGPAWPLSTLRHLPAPASPGHHTFTSESAHFILLSSRWSCSPCRKHLRGVKRCDSFEGWIGHQQGLEPFPSERLFFFKKKEVVKCHWVALPSVCAF